MGEARVDVGRNNEQLISATTEEIGNTLLRSGESGISEFKLASYLGRHSSHDVCRPMIRGAGFRLLKKAKESLSNLGEGPGRIANW
jgi:hypothetical protein